MMALKIMKMQVMMKLSTAFSCWEPVEGDVDLLKPPKSGILYSFSHLTLLNTLMMTRRRMTRRDILPGTILFVMISWISFIIDPKIVPGRMSLLVILLLVIINVFNNVKWEKLYNIPDFGGFSRSTSPSTGSQQLNAVESFIMTCIFMIFSAIFEYALILSIYTRKWDEHNYSINYESPTLKDRAYMVYKKPRLLDLISIILFSSTFVLYNFHYWAIADHKYDDN
jgi:hypothetical protein